MPVRRFKTRNGLLTMGVKKLLSILLHEKGDGPKRLSFWFVTEIVDDREVVHKWFELGFQAVFSQIARKVVQKHLHAGG